MTIEQSLDRIAVALEAIVAAIPNEAHCGCAKPQEVAPAETPKKEAPKKAAKKAAPKQEAPAEPVQPEVVEAEVVQEDDLDLGLDTTPAEPVKTYTADDVRSAISDFITSFEDIKEGKKAALEVLNRYGYSKIPEIAEKDFAAIIADVSKGDK